MLRVGIGVTVLGALGALLVLFGGGPRVFDTVIPAVLAFGVLGGAAGGIRFFLLPWGALGDPRRGGGLDEAPFVAGYADVFVDYLRALGLWLLGAVPTGIALAISSRDGTAVWVVPLVLGLLWSIAYGIACLGLALIAIPSVILARLARSRRGGPPVNPWWSFLAVYLGVLVLGVAAIVVAVVLTPPLIGAGSGGVVLTILTVDTAGLRAGQVVALWVARGLVVVMAALMVAALVLGRARLRELRRGAGAPPSS